MSLYSEYLRRYIHENNIKVASLIEYLHIDRPTMYKIINGKRNPSNKELVDNIAYFFKLSPQERQKYFYSYYCTLIGERRYRQYKEIESFLLHYKIPQYLKWEGISHDKDNKMKDIIVIKGKESLNYYMQYLLEQELLLEHPQIYYIGQNQYDFLLDFLMNVGYTHECFSLYQILCLDNQNEMMMKNMQEIEKSILLSNHIPHYFPRFYYDNTCSHFGNMNLFNHMLVCSCGGITFTDDFQYGLFYTQKEVIDFLMNIYYQYEMETQPLIDIVTSLDDQYEVVGQLIMKEKIEEGYFLSKEPCLVALIDKDMLMKYVQPILKENQNLYMQLQEYIETVQTFINKDKIYCYMTLSGIQNFIETGRVQGFPEYCLKTVDLKDRFALMQRLKEQIKSGNVKILTEKYEKMSENLHIFVTPVFGYILLSDYQSSLKYINFKEQSIIEQLFDYMKLLQIENLYEDIIVNQEQSCRFIDDMIRHYNKKELS